MANKNKYIIFLIILVLLLVTFIFLGSWKTSYVVKESYTIQKVYTTEKCDYVKVPIQTVEKEEKEILREEDIIVEAGNRFVKSIYVPEMANIKLYFRSDDTLNVWLINSEEWEIMVDNNYKEEPQNPLIKQFNTNEGTFNRYVSESDIYYLDLKNNHKYEDIVVFIVTIKTEESVTKTIYENEKVCHDVTSSKPVTKYRDVTKYCSALSKLVGDC